LNGPWRVLSANVREQSHPATPPRWKTRGGDPGVLGEPRLSRLTPPRRAGHLTADAAGLRFGTPAPLFNIGINYDVSSDGQRFLALTPVDEREASPMTVVANWQGLLKK